MCRFDKWGTKLFSVRSWNFPIFGDNLVCFGLFDVCQFTLRLYEIALGKGYLAVFVMKENFWCRKWKKVKLKGVGRVSSDLVD